MCWTLDARDPAAARSARRAAAAALRPFTSSQDVLGAAELIVGELLSNAARHAQGNVCLELRHVEGHAEISIHDTSSAFALDIRRPPDTYAESGRGLYIISELARQVSVVPLPGLGKRISVVLDLPVPRLPEGQHTCARQWLHHESGVCMAPRVSRYYPTRAKAQAETKSMA